MTALIDTSILLATFAATDAKHDAAVSVIKSLRKEAKIVTQPVLNEVFQMVAARLHYRLAVDALIRMRFAFTIEQVQSEDLTRMIDIMQQYQDNEFDYVDVAIMAVAERLNIQRVCTFDRRDFGVYRPRHCSYFELLP
jgi:hypothetical protein